MNIALETQATNNPEIRLMQNIDNDEDFIDQYEERLIEFINSDEKSIALEPMNSYYRRLLHKLALEFKFKTHSEGEGKERHIILTKNEKSSIPERKGKKTSVVWNFGDQEFLVNSLIDEVEIYLAKDGSVGLYDENAKIPYITKKTVVSGMFKIKMNKIVEVHDEEW
ncbi:hypothetical protein KKA14_02840 [bacterium]|nr:hypothetical protein [bacterium]